MSSVPKSKRNESKQKFDSIYMTMHDEAVKMIELNFHAKASVVEKNKIYIETASKNLLQLIWDLTFHIKIANSIYPTTSEELLERRIEQEKALGICFDILTFYELTFHTLNVKGDMGVQEIQTVVHEINAIKAWRTSDNKNFRDLK